VISKNLESGRSSWPHSNLIRPDEMPVPTGLTYRDGAPIVYDPADYPAAFDRLLATLDYDGWRARQAERRGGPRPIGIGLCAYVEGTGIGPFEGADIRVDPDGTVFVHLGVCAQGQGHETTLAQIAADELGVALESVAVVGGDTSLVGYGMGTIASRVAAVGGPAVQRSAAQNERYRQAFEEVATICRERGTAVQTIKAIARGPWAAADRSHATWYQPLERQEDIDRAVHWVVGRPGIFLNTAGDLGLLPKVLDAASRFTRRPSDEEMTALHDATRMSSLFGLPT